MIDAFEGEGSATCSRSPSLSVDAKIFLPMPRVQLMCARCVRRTIRSLNE